jgi:hypothetical protein
MPIFSWKYNLRQMKRALETYIVEKNVSRNSIKTIKAKHFCLAS